MKLTIKTQSGQKVVDLNSDLQFNTIKGEQYVFSNGFSNYVLNFKDNQESVTLTFNVDGKSIILYYYTILIKSLKSFFISKF